MDITNDQKAVITEWLATEVLGLERADIDWFDSEYETEWQRENEQFIERIGLNEVGEYYIDREADGFVLRKDFDPFTSAQQALDCYEALEEGLLLKLYSHPYYPQAGRKQCVISRPDDSEPFYNMIGQGVAETTLKAWCIAIFRASGGEL